MEINVSIATQKPLSSSNTRSAFEEQISVRESYKKCDKIFTNDKLSTCQLILYKKRLVGIFLTSALFTPGTYGQEVTNRGTEKASDTILDVYLTSSKTINETLDRFSPFFELFVISEISFSSFFAPVQLVVATGKMYTITWTDTGRKCQQQ